MKHALVLGLCAASGLYVFWTMPPGPSTAPDSGTYLAMAPIVPLGYPLFLKVFGADAAVVVQLLAFVMALAWLGLEIQRATANVTFALAVLLAIVLTPDLTAYHSSVLTESLFASGVMAIIAAAMRFVREPSWPDAAVAAVIGGLTATVRTTAVAFVPVLAVMVALEWRRLAFALSRQDTLEFREEEPVRFIQAAVIGLGWVTGALAVLGTAAAVVRHPLPDSLAIASLAALVGHAGLLFSALFAAGISRFMITLWPAILIAVFFAAWYGVEQVAKRRSVTREARL